MNIKKILVLVALSAASSALRAADEGRVVIHDPFGIKPVALHLLNQDSDVQRAVHNNVNVNIAQALTRGGAISSQIQDGNAEVTRVLRGHVESQMAAHKNECHKPAEPATDGDSKREDADRKSERSVLRADMASSIAVLEGRLDHLEAFGLGRVRATSNHKPLGELLNHALFNKDGSAFNPEDVAVLKVILGVNEAGKSGRLDAINQQMLRLNSSINDRNREFEERLRALEHPGRVNGSDTSPSSSPRAPEAHASLAAPDLTLTSLSSNAHASAAPAPAATTSNINRAELPPVAERAALFGNPVKPSGKSTKKANGKAKTNATPKIEVPADNAPAIAATPVESADKPMTESSPAPAPADGSSAATAVSEKPATFVEVQS